MNWPIRGIRFGRVATFDVRRGVGVVVDESTFAEDSEADDLERAGLFFHCTAIADGSRTIECGQTVAYELSPGATGGWEATSVRPLPDRELDSAAPSSGAGASPGAASAQVSDAPR